MPIAIFEFDYRAAEAGSTADAALERVREALTAISKPDLRAEITRRIGHEIFVSDVDALDEGVGLRISVGMNEPPRRADTVKTILDELRRIEHALAYYLDYQIVAAFSDQNWDRTHGVTTGSELVRTKGFKVGSARKRSWWFPIGFALGCLVTFYALNFQTVNRQVVDMIVEMQR